LNLLLLCAIATASTTFVAAVAAATKLVAIVAAETKLVAAVLHARVAVVV
jgi:hypothetical protein